MLEKVTDERDLLKRIGVQDVIRNETLQAEVKRLEGQSIKDLRRLADAELQLSAIHDIVDGLNCAHEFGKKCLTCDIKAAFTKNRKEPRASEGQPIPWKVHWDHASVFLSSHVILEGEEFNRGWRAAVDKIQEAVDERDREPNS